MRASSFKHSLLSLDVDISMWLAGYVCSRLWG